MTRTSWVYEQSGNQTRIYRAAPRSLAFEKVLTGWLDARGFSQGFIETLVDLPFRSYLWETPPVTAASLSRPFEFAVTECAALDRRPDPEPFRGPLEGIKENGIACFDNLGGDADLIVPVADGDSGNGAHLGAFCRSASTARQLALWQAVARSMRAHLDSEPLWLSTSGLGVAWLHLRLDRSPKYYVHEPYREFPATSA